MVVNSIVTERPDGLAVFFDIGYNKDTRNRRPGCRTHVDFRLTEVSRELHLTLTVQSLTAQRDYAMVQKRFANNRYAVRCQRMRRINADDFCAQCSARRTDLYLGWGIKRRAN